MMQQAQAPAKRTEKQKKRHLIWKQMKANYFLYIFLLPATVVTRMPWRLA